MNNLFKNLLMYTKDKTYYICKNIYLKKKTTERINTNQLVMACIEKKLSRYKIICLLY